MEQLKRSPLRKANNHRGKTGDVVELGRKGDVVELVELPGGATLKYLEYGPKRSRPRSVSGFAANQGRKYGLEGV